MKTKSKEEPEYEETWGPPGYTRNMSMAYIGAVEHVLQWAKTIHLKECPKK